MPESLSSRLEPALPLLTELHKAGLAYSAISRLAPYQHGLRLVAGKLSSLDDPYARKLAACALGYLEDVSLSDFDAAVQSEIKRSASGDFMEALNAQSTIEDLVFSAVRLVKDDRSRETGLSFLARVVEDVAMDRQYWNTSHYAIASLLALDRIQHVGLFQRWSRRIDGEPPAHESCPSFEPEREWRDAINEGKTDQILELLKQEEEESVQVTLAPPEQQLLNNLIHAIAESDG